ncbi:phosphoglycerate mutase family protein [Pseudarthrobacter sp. So.54]
MSAPGKIIMIRHGQSAANADTSIYNRVPDYRIPLTELGIEQARAAAKRSGGCWTARRSASTSRPTCGPTRPWRRSISARWWSG